MVDSEVREELLSQSPELNLDQTLAFIEAKEQGKRSQKALDGTGLASSEVNKVTTYQQGKREDRVDSTETKKKACKFCGRTGHGENPSLSVREKNCPAWNKECNNCQTKGHFKSRCNKTGAKVESVKVQHKNMICSLGATRVAKTKGQVDRASVSGRVNCMEVPRLEEPIPHIQFGEKVTIGSPLPQPTLVVKVTVDPDFYKMAGLRVPSAKNLKPVEIKLTMDTGAQVVT